MAKCSRWAFVAVAGAEACGGRSTLVTSPPSVAAADSAVRAAIAVEQAIDPASFPERSVGVAPFRVLGIDSSLQVLGIGLADLLVTDLSRSKLLTVVDRLRMDALLRELELARTGYVDSTLAVRAGRLVGARHLVVGTILADPGEPVWLYGRVGDVVKGTTVGTEKTGAPIDRILDVEKALAFAIFDRLGVALSPAERALVEQKPTKNLAALLAYSRGVRAELLLDYTGASHAYQQALRADPKFAPAKSKLERIQPGAPPPADVGRVASLALEGVNAAVGPETSAATDPAFRQRLTKTIIIILTLP